MKIKNLAGFLLVVILVATGTTPVVAHEPSQCGAVEPIRPGDTLTDTVSDVPAAHIDITEVETFLSGESLTVVFHLKDLPETLRFNRTEHGEGSKEYEWEVAIDVDNDRSTGPGGFDTLLTAYHIAFLSHEGTDADTIAPIGELLEASVWEIYPGGSTRTLADADLAVSAGEETITIVGVIPGISSESRLTFSAYDVGFAGEADQMDCHASYRMSMGPWGCDSGAALIRSGQAVTDEIEELTDSYLDITKVSTSLSGETLTVVFHLRDVPETLTFNRTGIPENYTEYAWVVVIDADNDQETGSGGFEYQMLARHSVPPSEEGSNAEAPIESKMQVSVWSLEPGSSLPSAEATLEVSSEEETITLSGNIPGITTESRLAFRTYDYFGNSDEVGCYALQSGSTPSSRCDAVDAVTPGQTLADETADVPAAHIDITEVETSLSGERLTVVFHLRDLPETLRFNRTEHGEGSKEYEWEVAIDADNDRSTGPGGFDTLLSAYHIAFLSHQGAEADTTAPIGEMLGASVWEIHSDGSTSTLAEAYFAVSAEEDTITISGVIPGVTSESRLTFSAYDVGFAGEADQLACHDPYGKSLEPRGCDSGAALAGPGQTVTDEIEGASPSHVDITKVSTSLSDETLTVVFHLRDVPETLTFNRTGISGNYMEYGWEVLIDVDNDRETGNGGAEYKLSASHFVPPSEKGSNAKASIESEVEANVLKARSDGFMFMIDATLEVSPEEDTITLSGNIPGITAESQLTFSAYDYFGGSDEVGCPATPGLGAPPSQNAPASQCADDEPTFAPGTTATDDVSDVSAAYLDISKVSTSLSGEVLTVMFRFRDIPKTLTFNRTGTSASSMEYMWEVLVDVDADPETGDGGFEYLLSAHHIVWPAQAGDNTDAPIEEVAKADVWERQSGGRTSVLQDASLEVSAETDTIILRGRIPGITPDSRLSFQTHEYLGESDAVGCQDPPSILTSSSQCDSDGAVTPGESVLDDVSGALAGHMDVTEISTSLSGETLTVVFHFRDVPETLTFDRTGVPDSVTEYSWEVSIDVDRDQETGLQGFEYILSSIYVSHGGSSVRNRRAAIAAEDLQTNTWVLNPGGSVTREIDFLGWARIEVSPEEDTVTLVGEIPGITAESQLAFAVYDYLGGAEEVGCLTPFGLGRPASFQGSSDGSAVTPGQSGSKDVSPELVGHIDIRDVTTTVDGETLTVVFHLRDVPETLTFDRTGVPQHALEYSWEVSIDVDNDPETGAGGFDYVLSASYFVPPLARDSNTVARIADPGFVTASIWGLDQAGNRVHAEGSIEVSTEENTITLSGEIPGITEESAFKFKAHDYFDGSAAMGGAAPSIADFVASPCPPDEAAIAPGQRVIDAVSDTLPAYIDITDVSTVLTGETLAVIFHLRDVPETLEFNREGVRENMLEYNWMVSVDVDNNRETGGFLGDEYTLSAMRFVPPSSSGETVQLSIRQGVQANTWQTSADGTSADILRDISIEVLPEENTITLIGDVPGITSASRLVFEAYDYLGGSEQVACQVLSAVGGSE
ncbi:MAG: hypothetical protein OXF55_01370 [Caldilineaceae bacterium]|nr:hypothetical protein [Caldilineaceae bacterium]